MLRTAVRLNSCKSIIPNPALPQAFFHSLSKRFSRSVPFDGDFGAVDQLIEPRAKEDSFQ
jgi:hypothetical protein